MTFFLDLGWKRGSTVIWMLQFLVGVNPIKHLTIAAVVFKGLYLPTLFPLRDYILSPSWLLQDQAMACIPTHTLLDSVKWCVYKTSGSATPLMVTGLVLVKSMSPLHLSVFVISTQNLMISQALNGNKVSVGEGNVPATSEYLCDWSKKKENPTLFQCRGSLCSYQVSFQRSQTECTIEIWWLSLGIKDSLQILRLLLGKRSSGNFLV